MELNTVRHLSDIKLPEGVEILDDLDKTVASCRSVKEEVAATPAATDATAATATTDAGTAAPAAGAAPAAAPATDKAKQ